MNKLSKKYKWLITGGAGFIGSHLSDFLISSNQNVVIVDNLVTKYNNNIDYLRMVHGKSKFTFYKLDITNEKKLNELDKNFDFIIHQAALGSVPKSFLYPKDYFINNELGFSNILEFALKNKVLKKVVYASSSSVYGDNKLLPKKENIIGNPLSPYALSKLNNERMASFYSSIFKLKIIGLRYFNVFGPRQNPDGDYAAVIPKWLDLLVKGQKTYINGDGNIIRDFCYVDNVVQANISAALSDINEHKIFNIACQQKISLIELHKLMTFLLFQKNINLKYPKPFFRSAREGDIEKSYASINNAKFFLNYKPKTKIKEGLTNYINYILNI
jgi:UDP-N-acetylglucosamine 4-epimerase